MFELPEMITLAAQMNTTLRGKVVSRGVLGNSPHKFVWYNRSHVEFESLTHAKMLGVAYARGRWLFLTIEPGYVLVLGECGGKVLYYAPGAALPEKYHLWLAFEDASHLTATTQMWGAMELYEQGRELEREYIKNMRTTPIEPGFTFEYFYELIDQVTRNEKRSVKGLLTQDQIIPGLGNAIAQDILFRACMHPRHPVQELDQSEKRALYNAILETVHEVTRKGGRNDEVDLYNQPGGYIRQMDKNAAGHPCPVCSTPVEKIQYLGGACYFCPSCQK